MGRGVAEGDGYEWRLRKQEDLARGMKERQESSHVQEMTVTTTV